MTFFEKMRSRAMGRLRERERERECVCERVRMYTRNISSFCAYPKAALNGHPTIALVAVANTAIYGKFSYHMTSHVTST